MNEPTRKNSSLHNGQAEASCRNAPSEPCDHKHSSRDLARVQTRCSDLEHQVERLRSSEELLLKLAARLILDQESERQRVSKHLLDRIGSDIAGTRLDLEMALKSPDSTSRLFSLDADEIILKFNRILGELRTIARSLYPVVLDYFGVEKAIRSFFRDFRDRFPGIVFDLVIRLDESRLGPGMGILLYRIIQEGLLNACLHSGARNIVLRLAHEKEILTCRIEDNGRGFDTRDNGIGPDDPDAGFGLERIRAMVTSSGGCLNVESGNDRGTRLKAQWPCGSAV